MRLVRFGVAVGMVTWAWAVVSGRGAIAVAALVAALVGVWRLTAARIAARGECIRCGSPAPRFTVYCRRCRGGAVLGGGGWRW